MRQYRLHIPAADGDAGRPPATEAATSAEPSDKRKTPEHWHAPASFVSDSAGGRQLALTNLAMVSTMNTATVAPASCKPRDFS